MATANLNKDSGSFVEPLTREEVLQAARDLKAHPERRARGGAISVRTNTEGKKFACYCPLGLAAARRFAQNNVPFTYDDVSNAAYKAVHVAGEFEDNKVWDTHDDWVRPLDESIDNVIKYLESLKR